MADIPEGLDDLLKSIRGETSSTKSSALALIPKADKRQGDSVTGEVDERILALLGLEDVTDIDYDTYKTLLRERMAAGRMNNSSISTEEIELLTEEFKKVKKKTGRFKVKKKKINANTFFNDVSRAAKVRPIKALPPAVEKRVEDEQEEEEERVDEIFNFIEKVLAPSLTKIEKNLEGILETLAKQADLEKKEAAEEDKARQKEKRKAREAVLEAQDGEKQVNKIAESISKPAMGIFDFIKNFVLNTLMGGAFGWLLDFLADPAGTWDRTWKNLVNGIIGLLNDVIKFLYDNLIMPINRVLNDMNTSIEDMEKQINSALALFGQKGITLPRIPLIPLAQIQPIPLAGQPPNTGGPIIFTAPQMAGGGMVDGNTGSKVRGMGSDTQLVALAPGEVVMSNKAGDMFGRDTLLGMNAAAGGTNRPKMGKGILGFQGGGMLGLGRQGSAPIRDFGAGSGAGSKGYIIVPGHAAGEGAPGEMQLTPALARNIVENLRARIGPNIPIKVMDMHASTPNTDAAFSAQQDKLLELEKQGYEVLEIHMDASLESGYGTGVGVIPPMPGTDAINPVEADFARTAGAFSRTHRGGLAGTNRGVSLIELGNMSPQLQQQVLSGGGLRKEQLDALTRPLEDSLVRGMNLIPSSVQVSPLSSGGRTEIHVPPPVVSPSVTVLPVPVGGGKNEPMSNSVANQKQVPSISSTDANNFEMMVVKSIYNIVG
jgi:F0F1-type ATP synthase assembly protein I